jgi:hypothetical protein
MIGADKDALLSWVLWALRAVSLGTLVILQRRSYLAASWCCLGCFCPHLKRSSCMRLSPHSLQLTIDHLSLRQCCPRDSWQQTWCWCERMVPAIPWDCCIQSHIVLFEVITVFYYQGRLLDGDDFCFQLEPTIFRPPLFQAYRPLGDAPRPSGGL